MLKVNGQSVPGSITTSTNMDMNEALPPDLGFFSSLKLCSARLNLMSQFYIVFLRTLPLIRTYLCPLSQHSRFFHRAKPSPLQFA